MFYRICKFICWVNLKIVFRLKVYGKENIPKEEAVMLVANHISFLDPVVVGAAFNRALVYFAHRNLFKLPFFGRLLWSVNVIPLNRKRLEFSILNRVSVLVESKKPFLFFPEGRRSKTGEIGRGKAGAGLVAWKSKVKVIPVFVQGTNKALPAQAKFFRPAKIKVFFGGPLNLESFYQQKHSRELFQRIADRMIEAIKELGHC